MLHLKFLVPIALALLICVGLVSFSPGGAFASGFTFYVDGQNGSDSNPGSSVAPWKTLSKAVVTMQSGDTVIIARGIYSLSSPFNFGPAGNTGAQTTFRAAPGARVVITGAGDRYIQVTLSDYVTLDGLWFGGTLDATNKNIISAGGTPIGNGKRIVNSTIFNYVDGVVCGACQDYVFQNNRFVNNGNDIHSAGLYVSSGLASNGSLTNHIIIDHNLFVGGGLGFQSWHGPRNIIASRNTMAGTMWGSAFDAYANLYANNLYWDETGDPTMPPYGILIGTGPSFVVNNIFGPAGWVDIGNASTTYPLLTFQNNAFTNMPYPPGTGGPTCKAPCGTAGIVLHQGQETAELGTDATILDGAVANLRASFLQPPSAILNDSSIEPNFAKLRLAIAPTSPLYQTGKAWFGGSGVGTNRGPDSPAPPSAAEFWNAFRALGLREYDRFGNLLGTTITVTGTPSSSPTATYTVTRTPTRTGAPTQTPTPQTTATCKPTSTATPTKKPTHTPRPKTKPGTVVALTPANASTISGPVRLTWTEPTDAEYYRVEIRGAGGVTVGKRRVTEPSFEASLTVISDWYYWRVRACNRSGCGKWNASSKFKVQ